MSERDEIVQQALGLPPEDRAYVAAALAQSLATPPAEFPVVADAPGSGTLTDGEFLRELQRRSEAIRSGHMPTRSAADVLAELLRRQAAESAS